MARLRITREFYIGKPENWDEVIEDDKSTGIAYLKAQETGNVHVMGFGGRRSKPDFNYLFRTNSEARDYIERHFEAERSKIKAKKEQASQPTTWKPGTILVESWGYEQTNVNFYQVVKVTKSGKSVYIREIASELVPHDGDGYAPMSGRKVACPDKFLDRSLRCGKTNDDNDPTLKRVSRSKYGESISMSSYSSAGEWDGKPAYCSWYH